MILLNLSQIRFRIDHSFFGFVLCRLRGAVKQPRNGLLYAKVIENYIIVKFLTNHCLE